MNKICTSLEQSKKLIELGVDVNTADMWFVDGLIMMQVALKEKDFISKFENVFPCWSLSALLAQMPCVRIDTSRDGHCRTFWNNKYSDWHDNAVDACVELLLRARKEEEK